LLVADILLPDSRFGFFNYGGHFAQKAKTVVQALLHTAWNWWNELQKTGRATTPRRKNRRGRSLRGSNSIIPTSPERGIDRRGTPYTTWLTVEREARSNGLVPTPAADARADAENPLPGLENFYMAGSGRAGRRRAAMFVFRPPRSSRFCASATENFFDQLPLKNFGAPALPGAPLKKPAAKLFSFKIAIASAASFCTARSGYSSQRLDGRNQAPVAQDRQPCAWNRG